jgi:hypothetical protein
MAEHNPTEKGPQLVPPIHVDVNDLLRIIGKQHVEKSAMDSALAAARAEIEELKIQLEEAKHPGSGHQSASAAK